MATSEVQIANAALIKLGAGRITAFTDDHEHARIMGERYPLVRDAELTRHVWRFAVGRDELAALADAPAFGYAYQYQVPTDFLRLISAGDYAPGLDMAEIRGGLDMEDYTIEGRLILTDYPAPLSIRYVRKVTDVSQFDPAFCEALASRLAYETALKIADSTSTKEQAGADYKAAIREAIRANVLQLPAQRIPDNSWIVSHDAS